MNYGKSGVRAKQKALKAKSSKWGRKFAVTCVELTLAAVIGLGICGIAAGIGAFRGILASTPKIRLEDVVPSGQATIVYDCEGNEIDQYVSTNSNRIIVEMDQIPQQLGQAFVAIEDKRFYQHNGIDFEAIARSAYLFITSGFRIQQGGSTITQQLLKNTVFTTWTEEGSDLNMKKIKRKFQEQYLALELSKVYNKDDILVRYMNVINLGQNTLGVEAASQRYFGKSCSELNLSECAVIASITQNPSYYNPLRFPEHNAERRLKCLNIMLELEFITQEEYDEAIADTDAVYERIGLYDIDYQESISTTGSYFSDAVYEQVRDDLVNIAGYTDTMAENLLVSGGLRIESTMDPSIQAIVDQELANEENYPFDMRWLLDYALTIYNSKKEANNFSKENMTKWFQENQDKNFSLLFSSQDDAYAAIATYRTAMLEQLGVADDPDNYLESITLTAQPQAAIVVEDQSTGYVVALAGGRGAKEGRRTFNRATSAMRSPGSTFKVLSSFAPALDSAGKTLATVYNDAPFKYDDGKLVSNWYGNTPEKYRGITSIRKATEQSMNVIAVKNLTVITPQLGYDYLVNFGFSTLTPGVWIGEDMFTDIQQSQCLGGLTYGVTPYEMNAAYASIANMGTYMEPKLYSRVTDANGNVILDNTSPLSNQVIKRTTAFLLTDAMVDVVTQGTGTSARFKNMAIAGKTGTSTDSVDVWFTGFTPYYTCTVWAGYDNNESLNPKKGKRRDESGISKTLWRSVMSRVHENLPNEQFPVPEGIVQAQVCSRSGKLPMVGQCDAAGSVITEFFAEGTVPTEVCDLHYEGTICEHDGLIACPECPFQIYGRVELPLLEEEPLVNGSTVITENPDGTQTITPPRTTNYCQHDAAFFMNPDADAIISQHQAEIDWRYAAAAESEE